MENQANIDVKTLELTRIDITNFINNRTNYINNLKTKLKGFVNRSVLVLKGGDEVSRYDTDDISYFFQQDANFYYLTGVTEPGFQAILNLQTNELTLYTENPDKKNRVYDRVLSFDDLKKLYQVDVKATEDLETDIGNLAVKKIYLLNSVNSDSGLNITFPTLKFPLPLKKYESSIDYNSLVYEILADTRSSKTANEIEIMTEICKATVEGHKTAIQFIKPGKNERDIEMKFYNYMRRNYRVRIWAYPVICGSGLNSATLHYDTNDQVIKDYDLVLLDAGIRIAGYCSDVTSTVPANGKFTQEQASIYNIVLKANRDVISKLKPGVYWPEMHLQAERSILNGLKKEGFLREIYDTEELISNRVAYYFMPHGLGHLIGLEVHDVGGYLSFTPTRSNKKGLSSLRTARFLEKDQVITVEPGIYFIPYLLEKALNDDNLKKYFIESKVRDFFNFGGVRIEDNVLITETGYLNLTGDLPRTVEEIEKLMSN